MAESKKTKAELRETAEALCREYNDNIQNGNFQETTRLNDEIEQAVNEYTSIAKEECFDILNYPNRNLFITLLCISCTE